MSIESALQNAKQKVIDAYAVICKKHGKINNIQNLDNLPETLNSIQEVIDSDSGGKYFVCVIDYDGTILKSDHLNTGATFTLPSQPSHTGLIFQEWCSPIDITNNSVTVENADIIIGAIYTTTSGLSEFDVENVKTITLRMDGTKNWGDGTSDTLTTHTYNTEGNYTITCNGDFQTVTDSSTGVFGQISEKSYYNIKNIRLGNNISKVVMGAFRNCPRLKTITIPNQVTEISNYAFYICYSLIHINLPNAVKGIQEYAFYNCSLIKNMCIPRHTTVIGNNAFESCSNIEHLSISKATNLLEASAFRSCQSLKRIAFYNLNYNYKGNQYLFSNCSVLKSVIFSSTISPKSFQSYMFNRCYSLNEIVFPNNIETIESYAFYRCYSLKGIVFPKSVKTINNNAFYQCYSILEYDFSNATSVPTLGGTSAFKDINKICKIKVPSSLEASWKAATNWATYADYIVGV